MEAVIGPIEAIESCFDRMTWHSMLLVFSLVSNDSSRFRTSDGAISDDQNDQNDTNESVIYHQQMNIKRSGTYCC